MASRKSRFAIEGRELEVQGVRNADAFVKLSPRSQVLEKPGMYVGSTAPEPTVAECFDGTNIRRKEIPDYIEGIDILNKEAIDNAVDNCLYSIHCGRKPDEIHITLTPTTIIVENGGCNVPVEKMPSGDYVPTVLWGSLFTSSHYDEAKRQYKAASSVGGSNGVGGSLINIFSTRFEVLVEDPESHRRFQQTWCKGKPIIVDGVEQGPTITTSKRITETKIRIAYDLNFKYFGIERYSPLMLQRLAYRAVTASFTAKVPVHVTNEEGVITTYDLRMISDYAALFPELRPSPEIKRLEYYLLSEESTVRGITYTDAVQKHVEIPSIEALLVDELVPDDEPEDEEGSKKKGTKSKGKRPARASSRKPTGALQISFVNGILTTQHGVHVDEFVKAFFGAALAELKISLANGKRHISFLLSVRLSNPQFRGQHKATLSSPKPVFDGISSATLKALRQWDTMRRLEALNEAEQLIGLKKTDGKKLRRVTAVRELSDANLAGTVQAYKCTLVIVEGGSASTYPEIMRDRIEGGRDIYGILPLRGKPLNVLNASVAQLSGETGSMVYPNFKQALGLQDGMDYSIAANFKKLRYGHVLIATDADCDGWHILCLLILMFFSRFPSLVDRGYISYLRTPVLRVPGATGLTFYTKRSYKEWKEKALEAGGAQGVVAKRKPKYYKGLGTSSAKDVEEDLRARRGKLDIDDEDGQGAEALDLGFNEKRTGHRKEWLATPVVGEFLDTESQTQGIAHFIHTGLKMYSLDNIQRAIPNIMDGLKESMRKALCAGIKKFGLAAGDKHLGLTKEERKAAGLKGTTYAVAPEAKVFQIIGTTTEYYCYHHGEQILGEVVCNMCKNYVGTNNVTWFQPVSSFGTIDSGKSPDPRYAALGPAWWWRYAYHTADADLVEHVVDEGITCEPRFMLPVACWSLCNATDGVGTGYSTRIPGHNIEEVVLAHMMLLEGHTTFPNLLPWWRGFKGNVSLIPRSKARRMIMVEKTVHEDDIEVEEGDSVAKDEGEPDTAPAPELATHKKRKSAKKEEAILKVPKDDPMVCVVDGTYTIRDNTVIVTALPLRTFNEFKDIIVDLIDKKVVSDYRNLSSGENILFEIDMVVDEETGKLPPGNIMKLFRLRRIISMSNLVLLDERGLPRRYKSAEDILRYFHNVRLEYYERRRRAIIEELREKLVKLEQKMRLIRALLSEEADRIVYTGRDEADIIAEIAQKLPDIPESVYHDLNVRHLNVTQLVKLGEQIKAAQEVLDEMLKTTKETMWKKDLKVFLKEYRAVYGSTLSLAYHDLPVDS